MAHSLDGAWAKLDRARHHFDILHSCIVRMFTPEEDTATAGHEYDPDRQALIVKLPKLTPIDPALPLIVGDCIHNARSALDHLVFQLAVLNRASGAAAEKTAFPICLTPEKFRDATARKVAPFISGTAFTEIEKLQPYAGGNAGADDIIWALHQLDIIDKHRLLLVTVSKFRPTAFSVSVPTGEKFEGKITPSHWKPSIDGAEVMRFDLSSAIKEPGKVNVKVKTASTVLLENTGLVCNGMPVEAVLSDCIQYAITIVGAFQRMFFGP